MNDDPHDQDAWRSRLTPEQFHILREGGTEAPFSGHYCDETAAGSYHCAGCDAELFTSEHKFHAGCGWPAFSDARDVSALLALRDTSHGMTRTEIRCRSCGGHLGHLFEDGPPPTHLRYCINSGALRLEPSS